MNKNYIVDTAKVKDNILKDLTSIKNGFDNSINLIDKINDLKCSEISSELSILKKSLVDSSKVTNNYIKRFNSIMKDFNNLSQEIIKKTSLIEKVNVSGIITKK